MTSKSTLCFELAEALNTHALAVTQQCTNHQSYNAMDAYSHSSPLGAQPHANPVHHSAHKLNKKLKSIQASKSIPAHLKESSSSQQQNTPSKIVRSTGPNVLANLHRLAVRVGSSVQPQGTSHNDDSLSQRIINVVTSIPFISLGYAILKRTNTAEGKQYGNSMLAVGAAATLYHASSGSFRPIARKIDYWTIAVSSTYMVKATVAPENKFLKRLLHASLLAVPFRPLTVSTLSTLAMQAEFARQALSYKSMRPHLKKHLVASAASGVAFALEDTLADRGFGHVHGIWHLLATAGVATINPLLDHKENLRGMSPASSHPSRLSLDVIRSIDSDDTASLLKGSFRSCHDSALSLDSLSPPSTSSSVNGKSP